MLNIALNTTCSWLLSTNEMSLNGIYCSVLLNTSHVTVNAGSATRDGAGYTARWRRCTSFTTKSMSLIQKGANTQSFTFLAAGGRCPTESFPKWCQAFFPTILVVDSTQSAWRQRFPTARNDPPPPGFRSMFAKLYEQIQFHRTIFRLNLFFAHQLICGQTDTQHPTAEEHACLLRSGGVGSHSACSRYSHGN